ncbi:MAG: dihydroorotase [Chloroherpetonaceae bacterium]|nr:dihydroorotase [Chthonomonadaceae bacterium]MDW8207024.1 dihydroorotase [Chloroherpetonaceae bacterium]
MRKVLTGGRVIDPSQDLDRAADVVIEGDRIAGIVAPGEAVGDAARIDVRGKVVTPGLIDMHVHLREPGFEYKEDIESGTRAAASGGFTRVCCMPNTRPAIDTAATVRFVLERAAQVGAARVHPIGAATRDMQGDVLTEMAELKAAGVVAISDDAFPLQNAETLRRVMEYCAMLDLPLLTHNEDRALTHRGAMNEGYTATVMGVPGMPRVAEDIAAARNILMAGCTGCRLHLLHISTAGTVALLRQAKQQGLPVTGEACPHHWVLTEEACQGYNTDAKMNPPLRTPEDCQAIREGLADGTIDCIVTDHAPHAEHEKRVEFDAAPFGIIGLETSFALVYTTLVRPGLLTLPEAIARMTVAPARVLRLPDGAGTLRPGALADITVLDLDAVWQVDRDRMVSRSKNTPFHGMELQGRVVCTLLGGQVVPVERPE